MGARTAYRTRRASGLLAGALLLMPLTACSDTAEPGGADASPEATETGDATGSEDTTVDVDCSGDSCSLTMSGDGAEAEVLGTTIVLGGVENGRATFRVGNEDLTCGQGESASVGPLTFECTTVTEDTVTMTATLN